MQPGDVITLSISPSLQYARFGFLKPSASLTRVLGPVPEDTIADMEKDLRIHAIRALSLEISLLSELGQVVDQEGTEGLVNYCESNKQGKPYVPKVQGESLPASEPIPATQTKAAPIRRRAAPA